MKSLIALFSVLALALPLQADELTFEDGKVGDAPKGWTAALTGQGEGSVWKFTEDAAAPAGKIVLTQTSTKTPRASFNVCVLDGRKLTDVDLTVSYKALAGEVDQGGGIVWRYQDANNYYVMRMNPLEENFRVYKVIDGKRTQLGSEETQADEEKWHTLRVVHKGDAIECWLDGKSLLKAKDNTIAGAGLIGLWTKADAVTAFDKLIIKGEAKDAKTDAKPDAKSESKAEYKPLLPDGYKLLYSQDFADETSLKAFHPTDPKAWRFAKEGKEGKDDKSGAMELHQQSKYSYVVRSPLNIALIDGRTFGDFVLECDMVQTGKEYGHRDMCLFFGVTDRSKFYYVHMATKADPNAHNVFIVNDKPRTNIAKETTAGVDWGLEKWHHVRLERDAKAGTIKVYFDDMTKPIMRAEDKTFAEGFIGFGSFDDTGKVDNIRIWGPAPPRAKEKKAEIFPKDGK